LGAHPTKAQIRGMFSVWALIVRQPFLRLRARYVPDGSLVACFLVFLPGFLSCALVMALRVSAISC
jgi:hypothetical protein